MPKLLPIRWSVPAVWSIPEEYTVPFPYTIPEDYSVPEIFEEAQPASVETTTQTTIQKTTQKAEKKSEIDPSIAIFITAGMVSLFGGVMLWRMTKRKKRKEVK